jgi:PKD repeat protein
MDYRLANFCKICPYANEDPDCVASYYGYTSCTDVSTSDDLSNCIADNGASYCNGLCLTTTITTPTTTIPTTTSTPTPTPTHTQTPIPTPYYCDFGDAVNCPYFDEENAARCLECVLPPATTPTPAVCTSGHTVYTDFVAVFNGVYGFVSIDNPSGAEVSHSWVVDTGSFPACPSGAGIYTVHMNLVRLDCYTCYDTTPTTAPTTEPTTGTTGTATPTPTSTLMEFTLPTTGNSEDIPVADFTSNITSGPAPLTVKFTDTSTHSPTAWRWEFGDGNISELQNPLHIYEAAGTYTVSMTAANEAGMGTVEKEWYVTVTEVTQAALTYSITNVETYYPDILLSLSNPPYYPGRGIYTNISGKLENAGWQLLFVHHDSEVTKTDFGTTGGGLSASTFHYHFGHGNATNALPFSGYISLRRPATDLLESL